MHSKGSRRQSEAEQIHLQHRNAEKMQQVTFSAENVENLEA